MLRATKPMDEVVRAPLISALEECSDALVVYQRTLKNRTVGPADKSPVGLYDARGVRAAFEMASEEAILEKLRQDSQWLEQLIGATKKSLQTEGTLDVLVNEVAEKTQARAEEEKLLEKARLTIEELEQMRRRVSQEQSRQVGEERRLTAELLKLRNEKEKLEIKSQSESTYADAWLNSKREQQALRAEIDRRELKEGLRHCQLKEDNEHLVTKRIENFLRRNIKEHEEGAKDWTERRRTETKSYETEIRGLREEIEKRRSALEELQQEYEKRQEFINTCLAEKEAARRAKEFEDHVRGCAIKIQAWWRGVMVRCKLGPYRPEEKKKKRPTKAKK